MPIGKGAIDQGCSIDIGVSKIVNINVGTGTVTKLSDYDLEMNGDYDFDLFGFSGNGTWNASINSTDNGSTYSVVVSFTGTYSGSTKFSANASETGKPGNTDDKITYSGNGHTVEQSFQEDTLFQKAKVWLSGNFDGHDVDLYIYNSSYYS